RPRRRRPCLTDTRPTTASATARPRTRDGVAFVGGASSSVVEWPLAVAIRATSRVACSIGRKGPEPGTLFALQTRIPEMIRFFVRFVREAFGVRPEKITVTCNLFADHEERQREIEQFWLDLLWLPPQC